MRQIAERALKELQFAGVFGAGVFGLGLLSSEHCQLRSKTTDFTLQPLVFRYQLIAFLAPAEKLEYDLV